MFSRLDCWTFFFCVLVLMGVVECVVECVGKCVGKYVGGVVRACVLNGTEH